MTEIESPLGKKTFNAGSRKVFTVSDESAGDEAPQIPSEREVRPITSQLPQVPYQQPPSPTQYQQPPQQYQPQPDPSMDFVPRFEQNPHVQYHNHQQMPQYPQNVPQYPQSGERRLSKEESLQYLQNKEQIFYQKHGLSSEVKKRVEFLLGICRLTANVEIEGVKFSLQTLKTGELREITRNTLNPDVQSVDFAFELRAQTLAKSIFAINDTELYYILGTNDIEVVLDFINEFDENVITLLYRKYEELVNNSKEKYGLSDKEDVKEVVEAVKKP